MVAGVPSTMVKSDIVPTAANTLFAAPESRQDITTDVGDNTPKAIGELARSLGRVPVPGVPSVTVVPDTLPTKKVPCPELRYVTAKVVPDKRTKEVLASAPT